MSKKNKFNLIAQQDVNDIEKDVDGGNSTNFRHSRAMNERRMTNAKLVRIEKIIPDPNQPRKVIDKQKLDELSLSIKEYGVLQPITVEYLETEDVYKIISGERRFLGAKQAGLKEIPSIISNMEPSKDRFAKQLIENLQREDFSPIEKAHALLEFKDMLGDDSKWESVEKMIGIGKHRRLQYIRLLDLPERIQKEIITLGRGGKHENIITEKHARALLLLNKYSEKQFEFFNLIKRSDTPLSGDEVINKAREIKNSIEVQAENKKINKKNRSYLKKYLCLEIKVKQKELSDEKLDRLILIAKGLLKNKKYTNVINDLVKKLEEDI